MSSDIQQLTNRLLAALNSNYEVIDTAAVLLVISQLEQTTITKEQLEATRLGKYINLLRRRTWSESLARRAKNLLKKWRNMVITPAATSGLGMGGVGAASGLSQQSSSIQNQNQSQSQSESQSMTMTTTTTMSMMPQHHHHNHQIHHVSLSQPTSPAIQSSDNNQKSSRHFPGQPRNIENSSLPEYPCSGSRSSSINKNVPSTSRKTQQQRNQQNLNLSNGGHQQQQQSQQSSQGSSNKAPSGKGIFSKSSIKSLQTKRQPISFANLIESQLHPPGGGGGGSTSGGSNNRTVPGPSSFLVDDNRSQSPLTLPRIPRIPRDRQTSSPMIIDHSVSPLDLDQNSNPSREDGSSHVLLPGGSINLNNPSVVNPAATVINNNTISICSRLINGDYGGASIDLNDSNSNSNMIGSLRESMIEVHRFLENRSSEHRKSKKHKKDKRRHKQDRGLHEGAGSVPSDDKLNVRNDQNQLLSDETQICGGSNNNSFPIQETLSLSNSSLSRFPSTSTNITITASSNRGIISNSGKKIESDLTFAGKFKKTQSPIASSIIQIQKSPQNVVDGMMIIADHDGENIQNLEDGITQNLVGNGQDAAAAATAAASATYQTVINPAKKSKRNDGRSSVVVIESRSCSPFTPIRGNSNDSTSSSSRNSGQDLIEVVNHESEGIDFIGNRLIATALPSQQIQQIQQIHPQQQPQQPLLQTQTAAQGQLKTTASEAQEAPVPKENKVPKRRGRKKGSKGADAMLAQFNNQLFEGSKLLSLASLSSCKKVKTTKELLADIQNRKLESTVSSPTLTFQSRPPSTSSEPSLHSASTSDACSTNATISTVARSTPDKNIALTAPFRPSGVDEDSGSNLSGSGLVAATKKEPHGGDVKSHHGRSKGDEVTTSIEDEIRRLMSSLPIIKRDKIDWGMGEEIICTCTIKEIEPQLEPDGVVLEKDEDEDEGGANDGNVGDIKFQVVVKPPQNEIRSISKPDGGISVKVQRSPSPGKVKMPQKPIKSIFDLDYDEENDPLRSFVEAAKTVRVETSTVPITESEFSEKDDDRNEKIISVSLPAQLPKSDVITFSGDIQQIQPQQPPENVPQFEVVEDPNCPARQRYEIQTNCITKFHVHTLHNRYVPGVNGNWDQSDCGKDKDDLERVESETSPDGLYERVVPQYNFLVTDKIPKDLSHVKFARNYQRMKQLKEARRRMKRVRSETTENGPDDGGGDLKHLKRECPSPDLDTVKDIVTVGKREMDDGFDSNMNLSNCSDKAAVICSPEQPIDGSTDDDRMGVVGVAATDRIFPPISGNQTSNSGSRGGSSCSNSSVNLSNTLSCSNNGGVPNITVSHNISNNIEESGENSVEDNCSEYRGDDGDEDDDGIYYDDDDDDDEDDDEDDEDEDHGKFQVQVVKPESTWSTSTVGNKLVLTLKKTPISLSFKCTDKAGTSKNNNKRDNIEIEVSDSNDNDNEMAVAPDTVDSLSNNVPISGWNERVTSIEIPTATTATTPATTAATNETTATEEEEEEEEKEETDKAAETIISKISITEISMDEDNLSIELTDTKSVFIKDNDFGDRKNISETNDEEVYNDFEVITAVCSSPGLIKNYTNDDEIKFKLQTDQLNEDDSSGSISINVKYEDENILDDDPILPEDNNELLPSFNCLDDSNRTGCRTDSNTGKPQQFKEWHEVLQVGSYNDELLTILPYVVID